MTAHSTTNTGRVSSRVWAALFVSGIVLIALHETGRQAGAVTIAAAIFVALVATSLVTTVRSLRGR